MHGHDFTYLKSQERRCPWVGRGPEGLGGSGGVPSGPGPRLPTCSLGESSRGQPHTEDLCGFLSGRDASVKPSPEQTVRWRQHLGAGSLPHAPSRGSSAQSGPVAGSPRCAAASPDPLFAQCVLITPLPLCSRGPHCFLLDLLPRLPAAGAHPSVSSL